MRNESTHREKLTLLAEWMPAIIESVKKDLRNEHLKHDFNFIKSFFTTKNVHKAELDEMVQAYQKGVQEAENGEELGEFIAHRWIFRHSDIYNHFEKVLTALNPDFTAITEISDDVGARILEEAVKEFGSRDVYIFSVFNAVAFSDKQLKNLAAQASKEEKSKREAHVVEQEVKSVEQIKRHCEQEVARLTDKYEKKLLGMQKKYAIDTAQLKKQIGMLQKKLEGAKV
jgi:hypothetical protein